MRELELYRQYLVRQQERHLHQARHICAGSKSQEDYWEIVHHSKAADMIGQLIADLKLLDQDTGNFIKLFLQ